MGLRNRTKNNGYKRTVRRTMGLKDSTKNNGLKDSTKNNVLKGQFKEQWG